MSSEPDPPAPGSGEKIRHEYFAWARRGFDPKEVREFLATVASAIDKLETELSQALADAEAANQGEVGRQSDSAPARASASDRLKERVARLIAVGEREAVTTLAEAKAEAATIVSEATTEAESIRSTVQIETRRATEESRVFLERAKKESGRTLSDLAEQRRQMIETLRLTQQRLLDVAKDLEPEV